MNNKHKFNSIRDQQLREIFQNIDFEKATSDFIEKIKKEKEELDLYVVNGDFEKDLNKIKQYLKSHEYFCFEGNRYHNYIEFISEKHFINNICNSVQDGEDNIFDEQEYEIDYQGLRFNFLNGLGTVVTVHKI